MFDTGIKEITGYQYLDMIKSICCFNGYIMLVNFTLQKKV